jgi:farnesyl-diphosphate farnesyltransferase
MEVESRLAPPHLYLADAMGKVSRSFAVVVAQLEPPLSHQLATAYLICRVVDNIEDCLQPSAWKQQKLDEFRLLLADPALACEILTTWQAEEWPGLTRDETALMGVEQGLPLWDIYAELPEHARATIAHWAGTMARGMWQLEEPDLSPRMVERKGIRVLATEDEYNDYCYFVAGTVGYLGTELVVEQYGLSGVVADQLRRTAGACGRGLQKTNILKDFVEDHARQICYLPARWMAEVDDTPLDLAGAPSAWKRKVVGDVLRELHVALDHVLGVPTAAAGYRMASLLCLLPALHTLNAAAEQLAALFTPGHQIKIPRTTMLGCIQTSQQLWQDNGAIIAHCRGLEQSIATRLMLH